VRRDVADDEGGREAYDAGSSSDPDTVVYRISGAFFFGAASTVGAVLDRIAGRHKNFVLDCSGVPFLDSTAANVLEGAVRKARRAGVRVFVTGASPQMRRLLVAHGVKPPLVRYKATIERCSGQPAPADQLKPGGRMKGAHQQVHRGHAAERRCGNGRAEHFRGSAAWHGGEQRHDGEGRGRRQGQPVGCPRLDVPAGRGLAGSATDLAHGLAPASWFRNAASPASEISTHFLSGAALVT
jgi:anti-anti-sigma factor